MTDPAAQPSIGGLVEDYIAADATRDVSGRPGKASPVSIPSSPPRARRTWLAGLVERVRGRGPTPPAPASGAPIAPAPIGGLVEDYIAADATRDVSGRPGKASPASIPSSPPRARRTWLAGLVERVRGRGPTPPAPAPAPASGAPIALAPIGGLVEDYIAADATRDVSGRPGKPAAFLIPDDGQRPRRAWVLIAGVLVAFTAVAGASVLLLDHGADHGHTSPPATLQAPTPTTTATPSPALGGPGSTQPTSTPTSTPSVTRPAASPATQPPLTQLPPTQPPPISTTTTTCVPSPIPPPC